MASRRTKAPAAAVADELGELFEGIVKAKTKKPIKGKPTAASKKKAADQDILADLENELSAQPPERPHTPKSKDPTARASPTPGSAPSAAKRTSAAATAGATAGATPPQPRTDPRKSTDSSRSYHVSMTPSGTSSDAAEPEKKPEKAGAGGGWWGGILATATATASAAMKQAEGVVTNIQQSEEAKRWTDQVVGNVANLKGLGKMAPLPPFRPVSFIYASVAVSF